jgi:hypothetical protein
MNIKKEFNELIEEEFDRRRNKDISNNRYKSAEEWEIIKDRLIIR